MSTINHTPGPWAQMAGMPTNVIGSTGIRVARCDFDGDAEHPETHANAALIAAAPAMREQLLVAALHLDGLCDCEHVSQCEDAVKNSVSKGARAARGNTLPNPEAGRGRR